LADGLPPEIFSLPQATIDEVGSAKTIVLLAPDLKEELPVLFLRVRDAAQKRTSRVLEFTSRPTGLTQNAWKSIQVEPGKTALAASTLDPVIVEQLKSGSVAIVVGRMNLAESADSVVHALSEIMHIAPHAKVLPALRRGNVRGAITAGLTPRNGAADTTHILELAAAGKIECLVLLGADPLSDVPDADLARRGINGARTIISIDTFITQSTAQANIVLPAAASGEKVGTTTNMEGRISNVAQKITPAGTSRPDWMIAVELATEIGIELGIESYSDVHNNMVAKVAAFAPAADERAVRHDGVMMQHPAPITMARAPFVAPDRNSYDYRVVMFRKLYDAAVATAQSPSLAHLAPGAGVTIHPLDRARLGVEIGNNVKVTSPRATVLLPIFESDDVVKGTAQIAYNQPGADARELIDGASDVCDVRIEKIA
jgi:NADH-quinone oxidoreductase subunit G